jgi:hypothetical protein
VRSCKGCHYFARQVHTSTQKLQTIPITWPFVLWGSDLLGPFKTVSRGFTHLIVTIDMFSKWIEANSVATIGSKHVVSVV